MSSGYQERVNCLRELNREHKGFTEQHRLENQIEMAEGRIKNAEKYIEDTKLGFGDHDHRFDALEAEKAISEIKKVSADYALEVEKAIKKSASEIKEKLKKDLEGKMEILNTAKIGMKRIEANQKKYKKAITESKKIIASHTKTLKKIKKNTDKCYERERKSGKKTARCPKGSRKNIKSGNCEKK